MRAEDDPGRDETEEQRLDRNLAELLQELRIAALGVQVLFGFLLSMPFSARFSRLSGGERSLYLATLMVATLAIALLAGPVAYHRVLFRRHEKRVLVRSANVLALLGLIAGALALVGAVILVSELVVPGAPALALGVASVLLFALLWFAFPLSRRLRNR